MAGHVPQPQHPNEREMWLRLKAVSIRIETILHHKSLGLGQTSGDKKKDKVTFVQRPRKEKETEDMPAPLQRDKKLEQDPKSFGNFSNY